MTFPSADRITSSAPCQRPASLENLTNQGPHEIFRLRTAARTEPCPTERHHAPSLPQKPDQFAMFGLYAFGWETVPPFQHLVDHLLLRRVVHKKRDTARSVNLRISQRDAMRI